MTGKDWTTDDSLGLGGILVDVHRSLRLFEKSKETDLLDLALNLLRCSLKGLKGFLHKERLDSPAQYRLAFRELGLSLGLKTVSILKITGLDDSFQNVVQEKSKRLDLVKLIDEVSTHQKVIPMIETFWKSSKAQSSLTWKEHVDINSSMLATSLFPDGFLG